jgi:predicted dehydrogenase
MIRVAVVGAGAWGMNHVRTMSQVEGARLAMVCDTVAGTREKVRASFPGVCVGSDVREAIASSEVDAIVLATPAKLHAEQALAALSAGKHVFVEKPLALNAADAGAVVAAAKARGRILMVGHLMLYHPAVNRLRELIVAGELGKVCYLYSVRVNLGRVRQDENALWSLAPHDLSMMDYLLGEAPTSVSARGGAYLREGIADVVFVNLRYPSGVLAQIQVSWLDPRKERRMTIIGSRKMAEFDDGHPTEKLRFFDKGVDGVGGPAAPVVRNGEGYVIAVPSAEPLRLECAEFIRCIEESRGPLADGESALRVVRILEAAQSSLANNGVPVGL